MLVERPVKATVELQGFQAVGVSGEATGLVAMVDTTAAQRCAFRPRAPSPSAPHTACSRPRFTSSVKAAAQTESLDDLRLSRR